MTRQSEPVTLPLKMFWMVCGNITQSCCRVKSDIYGKSVYHFSKELSLSESTVWGYVLKSYLPPLDVNESNWTADVAF